jgi:ATP-binding cassette subfamily B protein
MRFYDGNGGSIRIDGIDIRRLARDNLRAQFGMVLQDTWLFDGSIRDNIAYAKPDAAMEEIVTAAKEAGADGFIRRLEDGYDTRMTAEAFPKARSSFSPSPA